MSEQYYYYIKFEDIDSNFTKIEFSNSRLIVGANNFIFTLELIIKDFNIVDKNTNQTLQSYQYNIEVLRRKSLGIVFYIYKLIKNILN